MNRSGRTAGSRGKALITGFILCALVVFRSSLPSHAASSGGAYTLESSEVGPGGGASGGDRELLSSLAPVSGPELAGPGAGAFHSGFLRAYVSVQVSAAVPSGIRATLAGLSYGIPPAAPVVVNFGAPISTASLVAATTVYLVYDRLGTKVSAPVAFELSYDSATGRAEFIPPGGWERGATYRVEIGTGTSSVAGSPIPARLSTRFQSVLDFSQENVVRAPANEEAMVRIPPGALAGTGFVLFNLDPLRDPDRADVSHIQEASAKVVRDLGSGSAPVSVLELNAYDDSGIHVAASFRRPLTLDMPFADAEGDGIVDGTFPGVRASSLGLWTLDEASRLWIRVPGSTLDASARRVTAPLPHFSVYSLIAAVDTNVESTYAYPIPWRPNGVDPARYGTLAGGITFINLPQVGRIRIYALSGGLVRERELNGSLTWVWDGRNERGENAVSGTYLWVIEAGGNRKTGKLMVIR